MSPSWSSLPLGDLTPWLRLRVWWRRPTLTARLAAGADPDESADLMLVACELIGTPQRRRLAAALDGLLHRAAERPRPWAAAVPLNRREILASGAELTELAERLRADAPVPVRAVALAAVLIRDGGSPVYDRQAAPGLWRLARRVRLALDEPIA
jgi:hypothetical protein